MAGQTGLDQGQNIPGDRRYAGATRQTEENAMSYRSILVNLDIDRPIAPITHAAIDLASRSGARLIGFCAAEAPMPMIMPATGYVATEAWQQMRKDIEERLEEVRAEFHRLATGGIETEWRGEATIPTDAVVAAARATDLVLMAAADGASSGDTYRTAARRPSFSARGALSS